MMIEGEVTAVIIHTFFFYMVQETAKKIKKHTHRVTHLFDLVHLT